MSDIRGKKRRSSPLPSSMEEEDDFVRLSVGGKLVVTSLSTTLLTVPGSLLTNMFDPTKNNPPAKKIMADGLPAFFIDESADLFEVRSQIC